MLFLTCVDLYLCIQGGFIKFTHSMFFFNFRNLFSYNNYIFQQTNFTHHIFITGCRLHPLIGISFTCSLFILFALLLYVFSVNLYCSCFRCSQFIFLTLLFCVLFLFAMIRSVVKSFKVPVVDVAELTNRFH